MRFDAVRWTVYGGGCARNRVPAMIGADIEITSGRARHQKGALFVREPRRCRQARVGRFEVRDIDRPGFRSRKRGGVADSQGVQDIAVGRRYSGRVRRFNRR